MTCPRVEVDLRKICQNTEIVVRRLKTRGITVTGVTKAVCGHPAIAQAMLDGGALGLAEARITNVQRLRKAGITDPITLPMRSRIGAAESWIGTSSAFLVIRIEFSSSVMTRPSLRQRMTGLSTVARVCWLMIVMISVIGVPRAPRISQPVRSCATGLI